MQNRRLLLSVIIKILSFVALLLLIIVFANSLMTKEVAKSPSINKEIPTVSLDVSKIRLGEVLKTRWNGIEVAILSRQFSDKIKKPSKEDILENGSQYIDARTRSIKSEFFVFNNWGDSQNCPLHYAAGTFKDVCSSNRFDEAGRNVDANPHSFKLQIPPHYFDGNNVIIGKWEP